jgi:hypothetical protein
VPGRDPWTDQEPDELELRVPDELLELDEAMYVNTFGSLINCPVAGNMYQTTKACFDPGCHP